MLLSRFKSQPKLSYLESVEKGTDTKSSTTEALVTMPQWTRSTANIDQRHKYTQNIRFARLNKIATEDYYRTLNEFK